MTFSCLSSVILWATSHCHHGVLSAVFMFMWFDAMGNILLSLWNFM